MTPFRLLRPQAVHGTRLCALLACLLVPAYAQVSPKHFGGTFEHWLAAGATNLFNQAETGLQVNWDSSQTNSYYYFPLGFYLTRSDDFDVSLTLRIDTLTLGTTPGKADTFEIAAGLLNLTNALDPQFFRGSGINSQHGARNLIEFDYFPASQFISATIAPTIATSSNQILFSDNHPMELEPGVYYKLLMSFTAADQTLRSKLWRAESTTGIPVFTNSPLELKSLILSSNYSDFAVDALALINYSDAAQSPPQFSGSLAGNGTFWNVETIVYNRPKLKIQSTGARFELIFETNDGWQYQLESRTDAGPWQPAGPITKGTGGPASVLLDPGSAVNEIYRVHGERL